jgi:hypothetical protein
VAVVIWVFSGGGEAEIRGLMPFLDRNFPNCTFERKTPVIRKPGPKPGAQPSPGYGKTGKSLVSEIKERLGICLKHGQCDVVLVIDDLDCRDHQSQERKFLAAIDSIDGAGDLLKFVGFAAPELEAWIIADCENSVACHDDFRGRADAMRHWLSTQKRVPFDHPETFSEYDPDKDACKEKLSDALIEASLLEQSKFRYSKGLHTPGLLRDVRPAIVADKCPLFGKLYHFLISCCDEKWSLSAT